MRFRFDDINGERIILILEKTDLSIRSPLQIKVYSSKKSIILTIDFSFVYHNKVTPFMTTIIVHFKRL